MIRQARPEEKGIIYKLWKEAFSFDDNGSIDYYFDHYYQESESIVLEAQGVIVASLQSRVKTLMLFGNALQVNYIVGVVTAEPYRRQGYMKKLLSAVLADSEKHYLFTVLQAYQPKVYESFGFETVIENKETLVTRSMLAKVNATGVSYNVKAEDALALYQKFTTHFTGYFLRTQEEMERLIEGVRAEGGEVLGVYQQQELVAYGFALKDSHGLRLDEVCYGDSNALLKLISYGLQQNEQVTFVSSTQEKVQKIIPQSHPKKVPFMMARVNQPHLFEKLYHVRIISSYSAFNAFSIPLFNRDYL